MDESALFIFGFIGHLFLGAYFFHLFNRHRLLPFFFLGAVSIPFGLMAALFALGGDVINWGGADLISRLSCFFSIFFIFLFFLSVATPGIFTKYSQPTFLILSEIVAIAFVILVVSSDNDILATSAFGSFDIEFPAGLAIGLFLFFVGPVCGVWAAWKAYKANLHVLMAICLFLLSAVVVGGANCLLLHQNQTGLLFIALLELPAVAILAIPEELQPITAMYQVYRRSEGISRLQSLPAIHAKTLFAQITISVFVFADSGPKLFKSMGPMFHGSKIENERLAVKLAVYYFALFGNASDADEDLFQKGISFGPLPVYGRPYFRSVVCGFKADDPSVTDPRLKNTTPGLISIFFPASARHSIEIYNLQQELEAMCKQLDHIRDVIPAIESFAQNFKILD
ncbi:MAG: hypothetical protein ACE5OZ_08510 [Candidatus Heimdallarchaeota archaeon]